MRVSIRCSCGANFAIDDEDETTTAQSDPGDVTTQPMPAGGNDFLGFTTPALGGDA